MSEESKPNQIDEIIKALDFNINSLNEARGITMADVKEFFLDLLGTVRDMWEKFQSFFEEMEKVKEIEKATAKGEKYIEKDDKNTDLSSLYL